MAKRVLITGASGQLGQALTTALKDSCDLILTDLVVQPNFSENRDFRILDITSRDNCRDVIGHAAPDVVINTAALTNVDDCEKFPDKADLINHTGVLNILDVIKPSTKFVQISSDYIFDGNAGPYRETDAPTAISEYGKSKLAAETDLKNLHEDYLIFRPNVLFGPSNTAPASFFAWIYKSLKSEAEIRVVTDQISNPTYSHFFAAAVAECIEKDAKGIYHYGSANHISRYDFALEVAEVFKLSTAGMSPILTSDLKQTAPRPLNSGLLTSKIETELDIPTFTTQQSLMDILRLMERQ